MAVVTGGDRYKNYSQERGFFTPPPRLRSSRQCAPVTSASEKKPRRSPQSKGGLFHVIHKVPAGCSPYVRAKRVQLIDKDPGRAISLFWAAINSGDRIDSALKDMAVVMKQLDRSDEAIEAIKSFRHLCPEESQESLDNILIELYKRSGRIEEEIAMLQMKLKHVEEGLVFGGKKTKLARSQGKKIQITIEKEYSRLLGNLAWAYMQQKNFKSAEENYRKALSFEPDKNKQCNLAVCLMHMNKLTEAKFLLQAIKHSSGNEQMDDSCTRSFERATEFLAELEVKDVSEPATQEKEHKGCERFAEAGKFGDWRRDTCFQKDHVGKSKCPRFSPQVWAANKNNEVVFTEVQDGKRDDFGWRRNKNWFSMENVEAGFASKEYDSTFSTARIQKFPLTQPRKCTWSFQGDQRKGWLPEYKVGGFCRKLSFQQLNVSEGSRTVPKRNLDSELSHSADETPDTVPGILEGSQSVSGDWRNKPKENLASLDNKHEPQCISNKDSKISLSEDDNLIKAGAHVNGFSSEYECSKAGGVSASDCSGIPTFAAPGSVGSREYLGMVENLMPYSEIWTDRMNSDFHCSACESKKSWADMVEEDERAIQSGSRDIPDESKCFVSQEPSLPYQTPCKLSAGDSCEEEFTDENVDVNIIPENPVSQNRNESSNQNIEAEDLRYGYYTQPKSSKSSMNRATKRSLCFDHHQKPDSEKTCFTSSSQKNALNFTSHNLIALKEACPSSSCIKLMRRNRLPVFQDITSPHASPRAS